MNHRPIVEMRSITKRYPGVLALDRVDLTLHPGEIHALVGENGSGKSTLAKCLYGGTMPDAGNIQMDGEEVFISSPGRALQLGIVAITQELSLAPSLSVAENILMGRMPRKGPVIDWSRTWALAREALNQIGVEIDERRRVDELNVELQQEVEIARAVSAHSRVLILDEATSSLSELATQKLLKKLEQLRRQGVAILFISHRLHEIYSCASRATVLRDGKLVDVVELETTPEHELVRRMVGRQLVDLYGKRSVPQGESVLTVRRLSTEDGAVQDISFEVRRGEILGIAGLVGCGKERLGLALFGAIPHDGEVRVGNRLVEPGQLKDAIAAGIGFVPDDRRGNALLLTRTVRHNLSLAWMSFLARFGVLRVGAEFKMSEEVMRKFSVKAPSPDSRVINLSGGNQQKVVLARWFALKLNVVVLAEPTRGIDVGAKSEVYRFIQGMAERGAAIVMISSEMPELLGLADRILVMFRGRIAAEFDDASVFEEHKIAHAALGGG